MVGSDTFVTFSSLRGITGSTGSVFDRRWDDLRCSVVSLRARTSSMAIHAGFRASAAS